MASRVVVNDFAAFRNVFNRSKHVVFLTGAGTSAESGIPTFRGSGGLWRTYRAQDLATTEAFRRSPSLVWEFYHYRREVVKCKSPNPAHFAIAKAEAKLLAENRKVVVITQNIDELHRTAGSQNVIELHGTLFKTLCTKCGNVEANYDSPICPALEGKGAPDLKEKDARLSEDLLPRCSKQQCGALLRPYVVWFNENLDPDVLTAAERELDSCDLCVVVGTSAVVYPAAMFAPQVASRGVPVAEFNIESTPNTTSCQFYFEGPCGTTLPEALGF